MLPGTGPLRVARRRGIPREPASGPVEVLKQAHANTRNFSLALGGFGRRHDGRRHDDRVRRRHPRAQGVQEHREAGTDVSLREPFLSRPAVEQQESFRRQSRIVPDRFEQRPQFAEGVAVLDVDLNERTIDAVRTVGGHSRPVPRQSSQPHQQIHTTETSGDAEDPDGRELKAIHLSPESVFIAPKDVKTSAGAQIVYVSSKPSRDLSPPATAELADEPWFYGRAPADLGVSRSSSSIRFPKGSSTYGPTSIFRPAPVPAMP